MKVLLLEDDPRDAHLVTHALRVTAPETEVRCVDSAEAFEEALESFRPQAVLADRGVPGFSTVDALTMSRERRPEAPFVIVGGSVERSTVEALKEGATDFVSKLELERLPAVIREAVEARAPLQRLSRRQREVFQLLASGVPMRDIAQRLGLSRKTVETHRAQVMARLGAHHVTELVRRAIGLGVVSAGR